MTRQNTNSVQHFTHKLITGSGTKLANAIRKKSYPENGFCDHLWADSRCEPKDKKNSKYRLQAHHIITTFNLSNDLWKKCQRTYGYDINNWGNGIMLPNRPDIACQAYTHVHRSNHKLGLDLRRLSPSHFITNENKEAILNKELTDDVADKLIADNCRYLKSVSNSINFILIRANRDFYCENNNLTQFENDLNKTSKKILKQLNNFSLTITGFGHDYSPVSKIGCANGNSEAKKGKVKKSRDNPCEKRIKGETHSIRNLINNNLIEPRDLEVGT